jgi:predicted amidohydrolase
VQTSPSATTIGLAQWLPACGQAEENLTAALEHTASLAGRGCALVTLPELWPCGYDPATLAQDARAAAEPLDGPRGRRLSAAAQEHGIWFFAGSVPELDDGVLYNTSVVYAPDGTLRAAHRKVHLYTPLGEDRVFAAGTGPTVLQVDGIGTVGLSTCFDGDHPDYARALQRLGARVIVSASAYEVGAETWWDILYTANALANGQWWVMTNQCGGSGGSALLGASRVIAPDGGVVAEAPRSRAGLDGTELLVVTVDLAAGISRADRESAPLWAAQ